MSRSLLLLPLILASLLPAQGLVGSDGVEPTIHLESGGVGSTKTLRVDGLVPSTSPSLWIAAAEQPASIPILGGNAAFGIDPAHPSFVLIGPLVVPTSGSVALNFVVPAAFAGRNFYLQALNLDPAGVTPGFELSDSILASFGSSDEHTLVLRRLPSGRHGVVRVFADAQTLAPVLPSLDEISLVTPELASTVDTAPLSPGRPLLVNADGRPHLRLCDGSRLYHYRRANGAEGFFRVSADGRSLQHLFEAPGLIEPMVSVSRFDPLVAVLADSPVPAHGGATLFLLRCDGANHPGSASPVHAVGATGALSGIDLKESSLAFLDGALLANDRSQLFRIPTRPLAAAQLLPLPPTGGLTPSEMDDEFALSLDGSAAVLTAGVSDTHRDVYRIGVNGGALNLSVLPGEYEDVSYGDLQEGLRLALAPDASHFAFVRRVGTQKELFVQPAIPGAPTVQLSSNALFVGTIDIEGGLMFYDPTRVVFHAGTNGADHDLYQADVSSVGATVTNLSLSSQVSVPPFDVGNLEALLLGRTPFGGLVVMGGTGPADRQLARFGSNVGAQTLRQGFNDLRAVLPSNGGTLVALDHPAGDELLHIDANGFELGLFPSSFGLRIAALHASGSGPQALVALQAPLPLVLGVDHQGVARTIPIPATTSIDDAVFGAGSAAFGQGAGAGGDTILHIDLGAPSATVVATLLSGSRIL